MVLALTVSLTINQQLLNVLKKRSLRELFTPVQPNLPREVLISNSGSGSVYDLSLKYFHIRSDMGTTCDWVEEEYALLLPTLKRRQRYEYLKITNELNLYSDKAQVFSCFESDRLIAQADICRATTDGRFIGFTQPNDISLRFIQSPAMDSSQDLFTATLQLCIRHFFSFENVDRVLMASVADSLPGDWLAEGGFEKIGEGDPTNFRAAFYAFIASR